MKSNCANWNAQLPVGFRYGPLFVLKSGAEGNFHYSLWESVAEGREHEADFLER